MNIQNKTRYELIKELQELQQKYNSLKASYEKDIIGHKLVEEALRDSEKKYRLLIDNAHESIIIAQDGQLKFVNPMMLSLMDGYTEPELLGKPFTEFIYPEDRGMVAENYRHRIAHEEVQPRYSFRVVTRNGIVKWVGINAALIEWQGQPATLNFLTEISDKKASQGAGLGLSIAKAYVEMLGGKIWAESQPGNSSTFYFTIPYQAEPQAKSRLTDALPGEDSDEGIRRIKVLISEDDETSDLLITRMLKKNNYDVLHVTTGAGTIEACRDNPDIDLILMDIQMPDLNGYEATRRIRQFNKDVVIIEQTAYGLSGDKEKAIQAGCNDYI